MHYIQLCKGRSPPRNIIKLLQETEINRIKKKKNDYYRCLTGGLVGRKWLTRGCLCFDEGESE